MKTFHPPGDSLIRPGQNLELLVDNQDLGRCIMTRRWAVRQPLTTKCDYTTPIKASNKSSTLVELLIALTLADLTSGSNAVSARPVET